MVMDSGSGCIAALLQSIPLYDTETYFRMDKEVAMFIDPILATMP